MRYEKSDRVQHDNYCCEISFIEDVLDTLFDEDLNVDNVSIIADTYIIELLLKTICRLEIDDFEFDLQAIDFNKFNDACDKYKIMLFKDGEMYVESAIDRDANYYDCDSFIFVESEVSEDAYSGNNRHNDVMVFSIDDY